MTARHGPSFRNPFFEGTEAQSRSESISSMGSDGLVTKGFAGHRDTLARLLEANSADEDQNANGYTPIPTGMSLFRRQGRPLR